MKTRINLSDIQVEPRRGYSEMTSISVSDTETIVQNDVKAVLSK